MAIEDFLLQLVRDYGLVGVFLAAVLGNATVLFPVPVDIIIFFSASAFNPLILGILGGVGAALGEMVSYAFGYGLIRGAESVKAQYAQTLKTFNEQLNSWGMLFVFFAALIPFPFDLVGIAAGLVRFHWAKFFVAVLAAKSIRYGLIAYAGLIGSQGLAAFLGLPVPTTV